MQTWTQIHLNVFDVPGTLAFHTHLFISCFQNRLVLNGTWWSGQLCSESISASAAIDVPTQMKSVDPYTPTDNHAL